VMILGLALFELRARRFADARWSLVVVLLAAGNPVSLRALEIGHPEELLGAALCVGAVLAALWRRPWLAAVLLGLALANKAWAVLAIGPVLLALPNRRLAVLALAMAIGGALFLPCLIAGHLVGGHGLGGVTQTSGIFQPWQIWWPLGDLDHVVRGINGTVKVDYRYPPTWLAPVTHPLIALTAIPASLAWRRRRGTGPTLDLLLLLAMVLLLRCVLDPWNIGYYHVPFLMALLAWEALSFKRPPVLSLTAAVLIWVSFEKLPQLVSPDVQCLAYLSWALPALAWLAWSVYRLPVPARRVVAVPAG
jgi:hypothetical protein